MKLRNLFSLCTLSSLIITSCETFSTETNKPISSDGDDNSNSTPTKEQETVKEDSDDSQLPSEEQEATKVDSTDDQQTSEDTKEPTHMHVFTCKNTADRYLAKKGTYLSKREYYYSCEECGEKSEETFSYGHSDFISTEAIDKYYADDPFIADVYKFAFKSTIEEVDKINDEEDCSFPIKLEWFEGDEVYSEGSSTIDRNNGRNILRLVASSGETHPELYTNRPQFAWFSSTLYGLDAVAGLTIYSVDGYDKASLRKENRKYFTELHNYVDPLIREDATEVEKALLIHLAMQEYWSVGTLNLFYSAIVKKGGTVFTWSQLFEHLAHRHNLDSFFVTPLGWNANKGNDFWNTVNIDGKWYLIDTCKDEREGTSLEWFCTDYTNHTQAKYIQSAAEISSPINRKLIQLYKNEELAGVFHNLDTALSNVNDEEADYKLILGIGESGIKGFTLDKSYYENEYVTNVTSCLYKTITIESCCDAELDFKAPREFFNQEGITFNNVKQITE